MSRFQGGNWGWRQGTRRQPCNQSYMGPEHRGRRNRRAIHPIGRLRHRLCPDGNVHLSSCLPAPRDFTMFWCALLGRPRSYYLPVDARKRLCPDRVFSCRECRSLSPEGKECVRRRTRGKRMKAEINPYHHRYGNSNLYPPLASALFLSRRRLPPWLVVWLDFIPAAILSALILPTIVTTGNTEATRMEQTRVSGSRFPH